MKKIQNNEKYHLHHHVKIKEFSFVLAIRIPGCGRVCPQNITFFPDSKSFTFRESKSKGHCHKFHFYEHDEDELQEHVSLQLRTGGQTYTENPALQISNGTVPVRLVDPKSSATRFVKS